MARLISIIVVAFVYSLAHGDDMFIEVPLEKQKDLIQNNFDFYHTSIFMALPGRYRIARLNPDTMAELNDSVRIMLLDDYSPILVKSLGLEPLKRGTSPSGYWVGQLLPDQGVSSIDTRDGAYGDSLSLAVRLMFWDAESYEYKQATYINEIHQELTKINRRAMMTSYPQPVKYIFRMFWSDIVLYNADTGLTTFRISSLLNNPEFVLITAPDPSKHFEGGESSVDTEHGARMQKFKEDFRVYKEKVERERYLE